MLAIRVLFFLAGVPPAGRFEKGHEQLALNLMTIVEKFRMPLDSQEEGMVG